MKSFLSPQERVELTRQHRLEKDRRKADRIKAILLANDGWCYRRIAEVLLLDEETVSKHVREFCESGKMSNHYQGGQSKLNASQEAELLEHLHEKTYMKASDICAYLKERYDVSYSNSGMVSWLKHHKFSYKKPKGVPAKANPEAQADFVSHYNDLMNTACEDEPVLFGDGVHPTMATKISSGWIRRGTDKQIATIASRTRLNLMGAINLETMEVTLGKYEKLNSEYMAEFFDLLRSSYPHARCIHLILDCGSYNKSAATQQAAKDRGIKLHFLPPYSPNLNPIERLWKVMNEYVRNNHVFQSAKEFTAEIMNFFEVTWKSIKMSMVDRINDSFQTIIPANSS